jgi:hypothetical protein
MKLNWLESKAASTLFFYSAVVFSTLIVFTLLLAIPGVTQFLNTSHWANEPFGDLFIALAILGIPSMLAIFFGMALYYAFANHSSTGIEKFFWFLVFLLTGPIGSTVYYFVVYRRRIKRKVADGANLVISQS